MFAFGCILLWFCIDLIHILTSYFGGANVPVPIEQLRRTWLNKSPEFINSMSFKQNKPLQIVLIFNGTYVDILQYLFYKI